MNIYHWIAIGLAVLLFLLMLANWLVSCAPEGEEIPGVGFVYTHPKDRKDQPRRRK